MPRSCRNQAASRKRERGPQLIDKKTEHTKQSSFTIKMLWVVFIPSLFFLVTHGMTEECVVKGKLLNSTYLMRRSHRRAPVRRTQGLALPRSVLSALPKPRRGPAVSGTGARPASRSRSPEGRSAPEPGQPGQPAWGRSGLKENTGRTQTVHSATGLDRIKKVKI